ncbi:site-specific recombinase, phage integrase family, partial [Necator americanus]
AVDTAHRSLQKCGQIFRYAVVTGRADRNPTTDLREALKPAPKQHYASIKDPKEVGALVRAIRDYQGAFETKCALLIGMLTFVRPGELRKAEWTEFDLDQGEWRIPAARMKMKEQHLVPLSKQAVTVLQKLHAVNGHGRYLFPSVRTSERPMSENTVNAALRRLGYTRGEMTGHGFRSTASTLLNELGWPGDAIERQLSHGERDEMPRNCDIVRTACEVELSRSDAVIRSSLIASFPFSKNRPGPVGTIAPMASPEGAVNRAPTALIPMADVASKHLDSQTGAIWLPP